MEEWEGVIVRERGNLERKWGGEGNAILLKNIQSFLYAVKLG